MLKKYKLHLNYEIKLFKKIICSNKLSGSSTLDLS